MKHGDILNKYFCKDKIQIPTIGPAKIANFHFSHYAGFSKRFKVEGSGKIIGGVSSAL